MAHLSYKCQKVDNTSPGAYSDYYDSAELSELMFVRRNLKKSVIQLTRNQLYIHEAVICATM